MQNRSPLQGHHRHQAETVIMLLEQAYVCYENPKMQGCIRLLEKIKQIVTENE